jgi:Zn finger protein HypA/HybF involved in hydrogenase expression
VSRRCRDPAIVRPVGRPFEVNMKRVTLICERCGNEERIEIVTRGDLEKRPHLTRPATCPACGSERVELRD